MFTINLKDGIIMTKPRLWLYITMQGGKLNISGTWYVLSLVFCMNFLRVHEDITQFIMVVYKGKGKRLVFERDLQDPASQAQRKDMWESCMFELELLQDIQNCISDTEKSL